MIVRVVGRRIHSQPVLLTQCTRFRFNRGVYSDAVKLVRKPKCWVIFSQTTCILPRWRLLCMLRVTTPGERSKARNERSLKQNYVPQYCSELVVRVVKAVLRTPFSIVWHASNSTLYEWNDEQRSCFIIATAHDSSSKKRLQRFLYFHSMPPSGQQFKKFAVSKPLL